MRKTVGSGKYAVGYFDGALKPSHQMADLFEKKRRWDKVGRSRLQTLKETAC
jgi:hypothetical protein